MYKRTGKSRILRMKWSKIIINNNRDTRQKYTKRNKKYYTNINKKK